MVEDDLRGAEITLATFEKYNVYNEVQVVKDGAEALDYLHKRGISKRRATGNPAVVMLDLKLPRISGLEVLNEIRETEELKLIPVVIMTSSTDAADLLEGYSLKTNAYVRKPVRFEDFMEAVRCLGVFWAIVNEPPPRSQMSSPRRDID